MPGQTRLPLNVVVDISEDRIAITRGDKSLGDWPLGEVEIDVRHDGFHFKLEEEEIILSVSESDRFAGALGIARRTRAHAGTLTGEGEPPPQQNGSTPANGIAERLLKVDPEEQFADVRRRIEELAGDLTDDSVSPSDVFGRWLRLLREINVRHGQGAMPTPLFYRLNTELLDLIPAPPKTKQHQPQAVGVGPRL